MDEQNGNLQMKYDAPDITRVLNLLNERKQQMYNNSNMPVFSLSIAPNRSYNQE